MNPRREYFDRNKRPQRFEPRREASSTRQRAPAPRPPPPKRPAGQATIPPKQPSTGKERRRMLKTAVWRLAILVHAAPATIVAMDARGLKEIVEQRLSGRERGQGLKRGNARRLVEKIKRLRQ